MRIALARLVFASRRPTLISSLSINRPRARSSSLSDDARSRACKVCMNPRPISFDGLATPRAAHNRASSGIALDQRAAIEPHGQHQDGVRIVESRRRGARRLRRQRV